jgi:hypothetical protein
MYVTGASLTRTSGPLPSRAASMSLSYIAAAAAALHRGLLL